MGALTAKALCRAALVALDRLRHTTQPEAWPENAYRWEGGIAGLYGMHLYIGDDDLYLDLDRFCETRLIPAVAAWVQDFPGVTLGPEYLILPLGFMDAANERGSGVAMRCLIEENRPVRDHKVPSRVARYYDVSMDEFKEEPCSMCVSFWVHTSDTAARLSEEGEDMRKLAKVK